MRTSLQEFPRMILSILGCQKVDYSIYLLKENGKYAQFRENPVSPTMRATKLKSEAESWRKEEEIEHCDWRKATIKTS